MSDDLPTVTIAGAGIIGTTLAFRLATQGYRVTLLDPQPPGEGGPSRANAGHIAGSDIFPISEPGIAMNGLRMLLQRDAPLKILAAQLPQLAPWLHAFRRAGLGAAFETASVALRHLCAGTVNATERLLTDVGAPQMFRLVPALYLYKDKASLDASLPQWQAKAQAGHAFERVSADALRTLEPDLAPGFDGGILSLDWGVVSDPLEVVRAVLNASIARGVVFRQTSLEAVEPVSDGLSLVLGDGQRLSTDRLVIAAGIRSVEHARRLGERLPLAAEGGYNLTYPDPQVEARHPLVLAGRGVVTTALATGLRIGGWAEFAGPDAVAKPAYFDRIDAIGHHLYPRLNTQGAIRWRGSRPSMPDSVPVLSRSTRNPRVFYSTGHGHYGLTWAARSADIVADLIAGTVDHHAAAYSIARFNSARAVAEGVLT